MNKMSEFLSEQGMNYTVAKRQSFVERFKADGTSDGYHPAENQYHLVRSTDQEVISPGTVTDRYSTTNPQAMVAPLDPMVAEGWITPDKGFLFKGGSYEVISFRIDGGSLADQGKVAGEDWTHFVSVHNSQGGGGCLKGSIHSHRIVCQNTAVAAARMASFSIRHSGDIQANYAWAIDTWKKLQEEIRKISERQEVFAGFAIGVKDAEDIFRDIYGLKGKSDLELERVKKTVNEFDAAFVEFSNPRRGTYGRSLADVYNAITATNTHWLPRNSKESSEKRMASLLAENGTRHKLEAVTMDKLLALAGIED